MASPSTYFNPNLPGPNYDPNRADSRLWSGNNGPAARLFDPLRQLLGQSEPDRRQMLLRQLTGES